MDGSQLHSTLRGWVIKTVCTNNSRRVYTNVVTRVCGSVGRLNPTTVVQMYRSKWWKFTFWNFAAVPVPLRPKPTQTVLAPTCQNAMESYLPTCINPCKSGDGSCLKKIDLPVMLLTSLQQSCHMLTIECKTSSVIQNTGYFIPGLGEQGLTQMSGWYINAS